MLLSLFLFLSFSYRTPPLFVMLVFNTMSNVVVFEKLKGNRNENDWFSMQPKANKEEQ